MSGAAVDYVPSKGDRVIIVRSGTEIARGVVHADGDDDHGNSFSRLTFFATVRIESSKHGKLIPGELVRFETKEGGLFGWWSGRNKGKLGTVRLHLDGGEE